MAKRLQTGIEGLDAILHGGFLRHNSILIKGAPGAGKTSLGIQMLLHGIQADGQGAVICSFEQFPQQLHRDAAAFGWNLLQLEERNHLRTVYLQPDDLISPAGSTHPSLCSRIVELAHEVRASRLLLDSLSHFNRVTSDPARCRTVMLEFVNAVKTAGITPVLTAELDSEKSAEHSFEEYLVDTVVLLHRETGPRASRPSRAIEITKSRGQMHAPGRHPFHFTEKGIEVYPRVLPEPFRPDEADATEPPATSGVRGIDELLGGGYPRGGASIVAGMSGCFKTTLAGAFLRQGADEGERGLLITFQEKPARLIHALRDRGIDLNDAIDDGCVAVRHYVPVRNPLEEVFFDLDRDLGGDAPRRVVIEGLDDFQRAAGSLEEAEEYLNMFLARLTRAGATTLLTQKLTTAPGADPLVGIPYADMVDTVVYLGNVEIESELHKVVSVPKSRSAHAQSDLREIVCDANGPRVSHKFHGLSGILQGAAHGRYKRTIENVFQPLYFIRDFAAMGAGEKSTDEQRVEILRDIAKQIDTLDAALKDHFGFDPDETRKE